MSAPSKELIFSVTASDCNFKFQRGRGNGGQKRNKTDSACICTHKESGAQGYAEDHRSQLQNKQLAFKRMAESPKFQLWHKMEYSRRTGEELKIQEYVEETTKDKNIKTEVHDEKGRWTEVKVSELDEQESTETS